MTLYYHIPNMPGSPPTSNEFEDESNREGVIMLKE